MALIDTGREMTWVALGASRFESDWMAWHRFLWMNAIAGDDLWRALTGEPHRAGLPYARSFRDRYLVLMMSTPLTRTFAWHFRSRSLLGCFGPRTGREMLKMKCIRFCPECLRACFHSPLFQLACVKACPLHGCGLETCCPHCKSAIGQPMVDPTYIRRPLTCMSCQHALVNDNLAEAVLSGFSAGDRVFGNLEAWMSRMRSGQFLFQQVIGGEPVSPRDYEAICACAVHQAGYPPDSDSWLDAGFPCRRLTRRNENELSTSEIFANQAWHLPLNPHINAACAIAKSVGRQIARRSRAICGHRHTTHLPSQNAARQYAPVERVLLMSPRDCPCCAALDHWRAYAGKVLALRNLACNLERDAYEQRLGDFRIYFSLEPRDFADALLSSFTWFATALARNIQYFAGVDTRLWYPNEGRFFAWRLRRCNVIPLETHRFEITVHGYVFSAGGERVCYAYSLDHAFQSLRACHKLYREGRYWMPISTDASEREKRTNKNCDWYVPMSEYLQTRQGSTHWSLVPSRFPQLLFEVGISRADSWGARR